MVFEYFTKKPFRDRLRDTGYLIKHSFTIIGKDDDIKTPTIHMVVLSVIMTVFVYASILTFITGQFVFLGVLLLLFTLFILVPFKFFYNIRQKADQSWIVYNTICGVDISYADAHEHTALEKGKLRLVAFVDLVMGYVSTQRSGRRGVLGVLINLFLSFLDEVWDLLSHYMIPAIVIEQKPLRELVPQIKSLKNNVPATLVGVFGIDFVGSVVGSLFTGLFFIGLLFSLGLGYVVSLFTSATVWTIMGFSFSWVPVFVMLFLISVIGNVYRKIVESIKVIYFTIFYTSIRAPKNIRSDMRSELTHYLLMKA